MKKKLVLLSMLALSVSSFAAKPSLPKSYTVRYTQNRWVCSNSKGRTIQYNY